jgi:thermosome
MAANPVQAVTQSGEPVLVLREGRTQSKGRQAMENNISAARMICEIVRTSLGPHGMDKLLLSDQDIATITNDGATMLKEMNIQHPAAKILVDVSKATDSGVGDGTTSAVVLAGALLERADELLKRGLHPIVVVSGYRRAARKAEEILESIAERVEPKDREALVRVATTSMQSKIIATNAARIASVVVDAVLAVATEQKNGRYRVDVKNIKVEKKQGGSMADTELVRGIVLDQKIVHSGMPRRVEGARIALVNKPFEIEAGRFNSMISITDASQVPKFLEEQTAMYRQMVERLKAVGANVLICQKAIDEMAQHFMSSAGILAVQKSWEYEGPNISRATGARMVTHLDDLTEKDLGYADVVEEVKVDADMMLFIRGAKNPKSTTILARGANKKVAEEAERSIHDAIMVVRDLMQEPYVVVGGGAVEAEVACQLARWANQVEGKDQLAADKYAEALEQIPTILAQNAGLDPISVMAELRAKHAEGGEGRWYGVPASGKKIRDLRAEAVFEPLMVKQQVLRSATEAVCMLLRIDNIIAMPPRKTPHQGEKDREQAIKEGQRPVAPPSSLATQL